MSSVGGGYGVKPPIAKEVPAKLNQSGILDKKKTNKDSSAAEETLSGMVKAFPMVRQMNKAGSVVGGPKLAGQSPIKPKKPKTDLLDDDELSALSKQYRQYLPKNELKALQDFQSRKEAGLIDDDELSALSKQFRPYLAKAKESDSNKNKHIIDDDELSALSKQYRHLQPKAGAGKHIIDDDELSALSKQFRPFQPGQAQGAQGILEAEDISPARKFRMIRQQQQQ